MAADTRTPLTPEEYAVGRQVRKNDTTVEIRGRVVTDGGVAFLVVGSTSSDVAGLVQEGVVRDGYDAVDPNPAPADSSTGTPQGTGTDGTDGTGSQE